MASIITPKNFNNISRAYSAAETAYWWIKNIDRNTALEMGITSQLNDILSLLNKVDNITIDIAITIKQNDPNDRPLTNQ